MPRKRKRLVGEHFRADGTPKRRFVTRAEAIEYAERYGYMNLMIYPCEFCGGFHFGTRRNPRRF
jgi:hypothetical protein